MIENEKMNGLWLARHRDANVWYHIYPFAMANNTSILHVVRHKKANQSVPNLEYHLYTSRGLLIDLIKFFLVGAKTLFSKRIDYIVTFNPVPWGSVAWILAKLFRKPIILGFIGADFNYYLKQTKWKYFLRFAASHSDIVTVTGNNMKNDFIKMGMNEKNIFIYPHCVKDEWFTMVDNSTKKYDVITVCNLIPRKRVQDIILALDVLKKRGFYLKLCIVGDGIERDMLHELVQEKELEKQVHFAGWQNNVHDYMKESKIYVQASYAEGFSISLIEAIATGLIPITTLVGSEADHIREGYNGFFFEVENFEQLAEKIEFTLNKDNYFEIQQNVIKEREHFRTGTAINVSDKILKKIKNNE